MKYALLPLSAALATATLAVAESAPQFTPTAVEGVFVEQFTDGWDDRWSPSKATKEQANGEVFAYVGKWSVEEPTVYPGITGDKALVLKTKAAQHAISAPFDEVLDPKGKPLVLSYEVKLQKSLDCGGAYAKLLTESPEGIQAEEFYDKTPYTILFGPDRCGATSKVHFIFRHRNPLTGEYEEKHLINPPQPKINRLTNLYTLIVRPENQSYEILINNESAKKGSLLEDFSPAVNPPTEIDDPTDSKPSDWVEQPRISDPDAVKPEDWDEDAPAMVEDEEAEMPEDWLEEEPAVVPDPEAEKPEEWSDEDDGDWIAPSVPNPKCEGVSGCGPWKRPEVPNPAYKGKWFAPLIDNPAYKGPWAPRKVPNPDYYEDKDPAAFNKIGGVGFELWSMTEDIAFDNIYIGQSESDLAQFIAETYSIKYPLEAALEAADKPEPAESSHSHGEHGEEPDYKKDPIGWAKFVVKRFVEEAIRDPKRAVVERPVEGGIVGVAFATVVGLLGMILSLLFSSSSSAPSAQEIKKSALSAASAAKKKTDEAAELVQEKVLPAAQAAKESVVEKVEEVTEGVRARTTRSQTAKKAEESS